MTKTIEEIKKKVTPILKQEGVKRSALFGSVVYGEDTAESDVDILVEVPRGTGMFRFVALERRLGEALGRKVDLVSYKALHPLLKERIMNERVPLYGER